MRARKVRDPLGCRDDAHEPHIAAAGLLEERERLVGAPAGREHRVDEEDGTVSRIGGESRVVADGQR